MRYAVTVATSCDDHLACTALRRHAVGHHDSIQSSSHDTLAMDERFSM